MRETAATETPAHPRVIGIDPGLNTTGYGVLEWTPRGPKLLEAGVVRTKAKRPLAERLVEIHRGLQEVIESLQPTTMALEQLYSHYERPRTSILMGHARGVICLAAAQSEIPVEHYEATKIKRMLTGHGRAPKLQMQQAIQRELNLPQMPEPADVADALAAALCHCFLAFQQAGLQNTGLNESGPTKTGLKKTDLRGVRRPA